jgi:hypothetical protein
MSVNLVYQLLKDASLEKSRRGWQHDQRRSSGVVGGVDGILNSSKLAKLAGCNKMMHLA